MDKFCYNHMNDLFKKYCHNVDNISVLDLGSYDVNGNFKTLIRPSWRYIGVDVISGPNVDLVMPSEYVIPLQTASIDLLISGNCLEHVRNPFKLMNEAVRVLKSNGLAFVEVPFNAKEHRYPIDCWRLLPDGMRALFEESGLKVISSYIEKNERPYRLDGSKREPSEHCWGVGRKI